jgi:hypothetical protein
MISDITAPSSKRRTSGYSMVPRLLVRGCDCTITLFNRDGKRNCLNGTSFCHLVWPREYKLAPSLMEGVLLS